jgi:hypothetical protein
MPDKAVVDMQATNIDSILHQRSPVVALSTVPILSGHGHSILSADTLGAQVNSQQNPCA